MCPAVGYLGALNSGNGITGYPSEHCERLERIVAAGAKREGMLTRASRRRAVSWTESSRLSPSAGSAEAAVSCLLLFYKGSYHH